MLTPLSFVFGVREFPLELCAESLLAEMKCYYGKKMDNVDIFFSKRRKSRDLRRTEYAWLLHSPRYMAIPAGFRERVRMRDLVNLRMT